MNTKIDGPLLALHLALAALLAAGPAFGDSRNIDLHQAADPRGQVEIDGVAGRVEVVGWERAEIAVSGTVGDRVDRVDLRADGDHATVHVVLRPRAIMGGDGSVDLVVHVPKMSLVRASLVSADLETHDLQGEQRLRTVSGAIKAQLARGGSVNSVSGDLNLSASGSGTPNGGSTPGASGAQGSRDSTLDVETISGEVQLEGTVSELHVQTVSGDARLKLGLMSAAHLKTISGSLKFSGSLGPGGHFEAESVSGDLTIDFAATPAADFDVESHTGEIDNCFGPAPQTPRYGPGSHLVFRDGDGSGHVRLSTLSASIHLCNHL
jgi:hypothetical protein